MKLTIFKYSLPFRTPFRTAGHIFETREGLLFLLDDQGYLLASEAAPLPGFSSENLTDILVYLSSNPGWYRFLSLHDLPDFSDSMPPSLQFACSVLWLKHKAHNSNTSVTVVLGKSAAARVAVNAAIGLGSAVEITSKTRQAVSHGFKTIKYKVIGEADELLSALKTIRNTFPALKLRLDANGCWHPKEAAAVLQKFEPLTIEYCEQPVQPDDDHHMAWLRNQTSIPLAADESARTPADVQRILSNRLADVLIIKPMLCGSITNLLRISDAARKAGTDMIFTTSLDSALARRDTAVLAAALSDNAAMAHGLSTGSLLSQDTLNEPDPIFNGLFETAGIAPLLNPKSLNYSVLHKLYEFTV
ncbi:MAG: o-succinylbenzoate synthase [Candidatus Cyclonatronum sp.]|uniref:o-succinylbenzoate synthase n=1 Tax=Cyclonatronum sp. TaxID=3024185 RepID=UPI0025BD5A29|nr:o-succinylbenzoate synthase [Cyclonatronum sp.]MCH8485295.1 o-succinylbenzoate synthase [Cyclonatronum sp.]